MIRVLIFINEDILESFLKFGDEVTMLTQQTDGGQQEIIEIKRMIGG